MPASRLSFGVTNAYREQIKGIRAAALAQTRLLWPRVSGLRAENGVDLDAGGAAWKAAMVPALSAMQGEAVRASSGYLTAFLTSELHKPTAGPRLDATAYMGQSRTGRPLSDALDSPLIGVKVGLARGISLDGALRLGLERAVRIVGMEVDHAARASLQDGLIADDRIDGYTRAVQGTCGACLGAAAGDFEPGEPFETHPNCECYPEPRVVGVRDRFPRPTGAMIFAAMTVAQQDKALGPDAAEAVRVGDVDLHELVKRVRQKTTPPLITQRPVAAA